jgi:hypothetical protein
MAAEVSVLVDEREPLEVVARTEGRGVDAAALQERVVGGDARRSPPAQVQGDRQRVQLGVLLECRSSDVSQKLFSS